MNNKEMMELKPELNAQFEELVNYCRASGVIDSSLYIDYDVKRGLRDSSGKGVLTGLTEISDVVGFEVVDGERVPCDGKLYYQGHDVNDLIHKGSNRRFLLTFGLFLLIFIVIVLVLKSRLPQPRQLHATRTHRRLTSHPSRSEGCDTACRQQPSSWR